MTSKFRFLFILIFILILFSCSNENECINNENNNEIIELELVLVIDGLKDSSMFFEPRDIVIDNEYNIYILDPTSFKIHVFDQNGNYLYSIGNKGEAPEEFSFLYKSGFCIDSVQNILIVDHLSVIKIFTTDGEFVKSINIGCNLNDIIALDVSNIYINNAFTTSDSENKMLFDKIDIEGNIIFSFGESQVYYENIPIKEKLNNRKCFMDIDDSGNIYACRMSEYEVFKFDNRGREIYSFIGETPYKILYNGNSITPVIFDICVAGENFYVLWGQGGEEKGNRVDVYNSNTGDFLGFFHSGVATELINPFIYIDDEGFFYTASLDSYKLYKFKMKFR